MKLTFVTLLLSLTYAMHAQFSADGGQPGSIAIHRDSVDWIGFATEIELQVGWLDVSDTTLGRIDFIVQDAGLGFPDLNVQPLGDCGIATATFENPFSDQLGNDFVVFENGFPTSDTTGFFELAFVEVSSNGIDFFRFPSTSLSTASEFSGPFAELDSRLIDGLAGRFSAPYGVPFDLADLPADPLLNKSAITHVRVIDVIGNDDAAFAKTDSDGMTIIDPYPTAYNTGGFDLDAIGILGSEISANQSYPFSSTRQFSKCRTTVLRQGEDLNTAHSASVWIDALGRVTKTGTSAPFSLGYFVVLDPNHLEKRTQVLVY